MRKQLRKKSTIAVISAQNIQKDPSMASIKSHDEEQVAKLLQNYQIQFNEDKNIISQQSNNNMSPMVRRKSQIIKENMQDQRNTLFSNNKIINQSPMKRKGSYAAFLAAVQTTNSRGSYTYSIHSDSSDNQSEKIIKKYFHKIERVERLKSNIIIQYPQFMIPIKSQFKFVWDWIIILVLTWNILYLPWEIAHPEDTIPFHNIFILIIFSADLFFNFRTSYYNDEQDEIIGDKEMFLNYLRSPFFVLDVVSTLPFDLITAQESGGNTSAITILKFLKLVRLLRLTRILSKFKNEGIQIIGNIFKYFVLLVIALHWMTLMWWALISSNEDVQQSQCLEINCWLPSIYHVLGQSTQLDANEVAKIFILDQGISKTQGYIFTFYSITMLVLGGEVTPVTTMQGFAATSIAFIGQLTIAIIFANMSISLFQIRQKDELYESIIQKYENLMIQCELPVSICEKIHEYIQFCWHKKVIFDNELHDFSILSQHLQQEINLVINESIIKEVPLFSELDMYEVAILVQHLQTRVLMPNEVVFKDNEHVQDMYFIVQGVVEMIRQVNEYQLKKYLLTEGEHFGEHGLLQIWLSEYSIQAVTFSIVQVLSRSSLKAILNNQPDMENKLNLGMKLYKYEEKDLFYQMVSELDLFLGLNEEQIKQIYIKYIENLYVDPNEVIIIPDELINAIYFVVKGEIIVYQENSKYRKVKVNQSDHDHDIFYNSIDDLIYQQLYEQNSQLKGIEERVHKVGKITKGQYFGVIDHEQKRNLRNKSYILISSPSSTVLGLITKNTMQKLSQDNIELYNLFLPNLARINRLFPEESLNMFPESYFPSTVTSAVNTPRMDQLQIDKQALSSCIESNFIDTQFQLESVLKEMRNIHKKLRVIIPP